MTKQTRALATKPPLPQGMTPGAYSPEERSLIATKGYSVYAADPTISREVALQRVVDDLLPPERQCKIIYQNVCHWVRDTWKQLDAETGQQLATQNRGRAAALAKPAAAAEPAPVIQPEPVPVTQPEPESSGERKKKVFWKPDETEQVALEAARLLVEDSEGALSDLAALRQAQINVLAADRQRTLNQAKVCQDTLDRAQQLVPVVRRNKARKEKEEREAAEATERMERERIEREAREKEEAEERIKAEAEAETTRLLAEREEARRRIHAEAFNAAVAQEVQKRVDAAPYAAILGALAKKVVGDFMGELMKEMKGTMEAQMLKVMDELTKPVEHAPESEPETPSNVHELHKPAHLSVVVVGIGNQEYDQLRKDFFGSVTFKQVKVSVGNRNGQTAQAMLEAAKGVDAVCAMHHVVGADVKMAAVRLKEMKVPYIAVTGSLRDLKSRIKSALSGELPFEFAA